jgi:dTMP kinase
LHGRGQLIAFEGIDGAGKSTVIGLVAERLRARGLTVQLSRHLKAHASRPARQIRDIARDPRNVTLTPRAELGLYCAREAQILGEIVSPALARGETVLLDRSLLTPLVLAVFGRGLSREDCEAAVRAAAGGVVPDLTLVIDVEPKTSRMRQRIAKVRARALRTRGRKGLRGSGLKARLRAGYAAIAAECGYAVLSAETAVPGELCRRVLAVIDGEALPVEADGARPRWLVPGDRPLEEALIALPVAEALYLGRRLRSARFLRQRALESEPALVAWSLDADDPLRELAAELEPEHALAGLAGRPLRPDDLRTRIATTAPAAVLRALRGVAGVDADRLRLDLADRAPGAAVESLAGREDPFAVALRERGWPAADAWERTASLTGCDGEAAWRLRAELVESDAFIGLESLRGCSPARADPWLARYAPLAPRAVLAALAGRSDPAAHALRRDLLGTGHDVMQSLAGLDDEASWELRDEACEPWPEETVESLLGIAPLPRVRAMLARGVAAAPGDLHVLRAARACEEWWGEPA